MEVEIVYAGQLPEVDIHCPTNAIPAVELCFLRALKIRERIADVLEIEMDTLFFQSCPLAAPLTEQVTVRALTCLMAVWTAKSLLWSLALQIHRHYQRAKARASEKSNSKHSCVHSLVTSTGSMNFTHLVVFLTFELELELGRESY